MWTVADLGCDGCRELAPELALGLVTGRERADAISHLQGCATCRVRVAGLTRLHDELRGLIPPAEPPAGFESRVLDVRVAGAAARSTGRRRRRPACAVVGAVAAAGALVGVGWVVTTPNVAPAPVVSEQVVMFAPLIFEGHEVGQVYAHPGSSTWIYLYLEVAPAVPAPLTCEVLRRDGSSAVAAQVPVVDDDAFWGGPVAFERGVLAGVRVVDATGAVVGTARFDT